MTTANFDPVARVYRWLEYAAFGRRLERARFGHLAWLSGRREILVLGDGDGRALQRILRAAPSSRIVSVDASEQMLRLAVGRVADADRHRVRFVHADARTLPLRETAHDAVVTQFFLDCFTADDVTSLAKRLALAASPDCVWVYADFALPQRGIRRIIGRAVIGALYGFFRWRTGLAARELPPSEQAIRDAGFRPVAETSSAGGLLRSVVFQRVAR